MYSAGVNALRDALNISLKALLLLLLTTLMLEVALQLVFPHLPPAVIKRMPQYQERLGHRLITEHGAREFPAGQAVEYEVSPISGDLYDLSCIRPEDAQPFEPYHVSFKRDEHGFRNDEPWPDDVDLVVIGDSFTAAELIQRPFWQGLSESMLTLGLPGSGTLEQQRLFDAFALPRQPELVILAFFAGNDLNDSARFAEMLRAGMNRHDLAHSGKSPLDYSVVFRLFQFVSETATSNPDADCHYPMMARADPPAPVAFYKKFLPVLGADKQSLRSSEAFQLTKTSISEMAAALQAVGAELLLMYIPQKAELYWNYLDEKSKQTIIDVESRDSQLAGLQDIDMNLSSQRDAMRELAEEIGIAILDLTPPLAQAIRAGQSPYFFADTHWNQLGHDIARNALLDFLNRSNLNE
ncbi:MAG: hypothetical protein OXG84_05900 [Chloroflexi bacterium]|nr:hypothetical protein [Chloroflexota bacterium]